MKTKILALLTALVMLLGLLTACGEAPAATAEPEVTAEETPAPEGESAETAEETESYVDALDRGALAYAPETVVMTINGEEVTWELFYYLLAECLLNDYIPYMYSMPDFSAEVLEGATFSDAFIDGALSKCEYYMLGRHYFEEKGLELSAEEAETIATLWDNLTAQFESEEELTDTLRASYLSKETYLQLAECNLQMNSLMDNIYGLDGGKLTEEDIFSWAKENNYIHAKHILYYIYDETGTLISDEDKEAKKAEAEATLAKLQPLVGNTEELLKTFDEIMHAESEDPGLAGNPDGYTFPEGTMHPPFEEALKEMQDYELSGVVETASGFHILLRLPYEAGLPVTGASAQSGDNTLRATAARYLFAADLAEWMNEAEIVWMPEFENLDLAEVFAK